MKTYKLLQLLLLLLVFSLTSCRVNMSIVTDENPEKPVLHALKKLTDALDAKNISYEKVTSLEKVKGDKVLIVGKSKGNGAAAQMLQTSDHTVPETAEALSVFKTNWNKKSTWVISGFDNRGLMYGLLDVTEQIGLSEDSKSPLREVKEITEKPDVEERAVSLYTMNRAYWESRFYDDTYWENYLDMLAKNRFNSLVIIFGYENGGFLAPCYPYFFDTENFQDVKMVGITPEQQKKNLETLNKLISRAHEKGIKLSLGIWDHIYRGGVQGFNIPGSENALEQPVEGLVWGLNADNLIPYTKASLTKLIKKVPKLDGIQFRMHGESGLKEDEQDAFWLDVFNEIKNTAPEMALVLRAKGTPESVIQSAIDTKVNFTMGTKYWMEQMGMPYHPTHINPKNQFDRRHGYADMLKFPQQYKMYWRLWNGGTTRILLWGDPDYAKRFAESSHLYDGVGFEINEPLATKMHGQRHDAKPNYLLKPEYSYYTYEFERYWHFYQVFGRLGYNSEASPDIWNKEFERRFGKDTGPIIEKALHQASWILPQIVTTVYDYESSFPTTRGWAEKQHLGDLPLYAKGTGSDIQQFASFDEEAKLLIEGGETPKILPSMTSLWFKQTSDEINELIFEAEKTFENKTNKEFYATITDLKILSNLALYHSRRVPAAVYYRLFERTQDVSALDSALVHESNAIEAWRQIVTSAGEMYADDLMMGIQINRNNDQREWVKSLSGHWKDELLLLEEEFNELRQKRNDFEPKGKIIDAPHYIEPKSSSNEALFNITHQAVTKAPLNEPLTISVKVSASNGIKWVRLRYRAVNQEQDYKTLEMLPSVEKDTYQVIVPINEINSKWDFMYFIEIMDKNRNGIIYPDLKKETPYVVVKLER